MSTLNAGVAKEQRKQTREGMKMSSKPDVATDTETFKIENTRLTLANKRLVARLAERDEELNFAKAALLKIKAGYESRVKNTLKMDIQDILGCSDIELAQLTKGKTIEGLEQMFENFLTATDATKSPYAEKKVKTATIRSTSVDSRPGSEGLTVSAISLYGKSPKEIREMGGKH